MRYCVLIFCMLLSFCTACQKPTGAVTIINNGEKPLRGNLGDNGFTIEPAGAKNFIDVPIGEQTLSIAGQDDQTITIQELRTQFFDPINSGCYALVDYQSQYRGHAHGSIKIIEEFTKQSTFTPKKPVVVPFNEKLPAEAEKNTPVTRVQAINCAHIGQSKTVIETVLRLP